MSILTEPPRLRLTEEEKDERRKAIARYEAEGHRLADHEQRVGNLGCWFERMSCAYCNRGYNIYDPSFRAFRARYGSERYPGSATINESPAPLRGLVDLLDRPRYDRALFSRCVDEEACEQRRQNGYSVTIRPGEELHFGSGVGHAQLQLEN